VDLEFRGAQFLDLSERTAVEGGVKFDLAASVEPDGGDEGDCAQSAAPAKPSKPVRRSFSRLARRAERGKGNRVMSGDANARDTQQFAR
jgi:hypothetical protein